MGRDEATWPTSCCNPVSVPQQNIDLGVFCCLVVAAHSTQLLAYWWSSPLHGASGIATKPSLLYWLDPVPGKAQGT